MFFFCSVPDSVATWCVFDQLSEKEDNLAEDCEEFVEELVAVVEDTFAELQGWSPEIVTMSKMLVRANLTECTKFRA